MKTLFVTIHHRRSLFYEEGMKKLLDDLGPREAILLLDTSGGDKGFGKCALDVEIIQAGGPCSYDNGMVMIKDIISSRKWDQVVFLDNDLFLSGTKHLRSVLRDFEAGGYHYSSYFENGFDDTTYFLDGTIAEVTNQKFLPVEEYPGFKPDPHWENAFMIFNRHIYDLLNKTALSHGRLCIRALSDLKAKMGVRRRTCRYTYSHFGDEWFHMGALMSWYYKLEDGNINMTYSAVDLSRLAYFWIQSRIFGRGIYSDNVYQTLKMMVEIAGEERLLGQWRSLVTGTCLEGRE